MMSQMYKVSDVWIGLEYDAEIQTFSWMDGMSVTYTNWLNKYPDPRDGNHVKVGVHQGSDRFIFWSTANKTEKHPFFCRLLMGNSLLSCLLFFQWIWLLYP